MKQKKRVYISGPMTDPQTGEVSVVNLQAFREAEKLLRERGYRCIVNPVNVWACRWPWLYRIVGYRLTLWYDIQLLKRCDAIYLMNGWYDSKGASREYFVAWRYGLEIYRQDNPFYQIS